MGRVNFGKPSAAFQRRGKSIQPGEWLVHAHTVSGSGSCNRYEINPVSFDFNFSTADAPWFDVSIHPIKKLVAGVRKGTGNKLFIWQFDGTELHSLDASLTPEACRFYDDLLLYVNREEPPKIRALNLVDFNQEWQITANIGGAFPSRETWSFGLTRDTIFHLHAHETGLSNGQTLSTYDFKTREFITALTHNTAESWKHLGSICALPDGGVIWATGDGHLRKMTRGLSVVWHKQYAGFGPLNGRSVAVDESDGSIYVSGGMTSNSSTGLQKFTAGGDRIFVNGAIGRSIGVSCDSSGNVAIRSIANNLLYHMDSAGNVLSSSSMTRAPALLFHPGDIGMNFKI